MPYQKKIIPFNRSFASYMGKTKYGKLKNECWDEEKNKDDKNDNKQIPRNVYKSSGKKYWFKCDVCLHHFDITLNAVTSHNKWCRFCKGRGDNTLCDAECKFCFDRSFASYEGKTSTGKLKTECWDEKKNKQKPRNVRKVLVN
jgi:hypothetical protein